MVVNLFDGLLKINILQDDWGFLCDKVFCDENPSQDIIETEFVIGTGITPNKRHLWYEADERFKEYIDDLRVIKKLDINKMCRELIKKEHID